MLNPVRKEGHETSTNDSTICSDNDNFKKKLFSDTYSSNVRDKMDTASDNDELPSPSSGEYECILRCGQPCTKSVYLGNIKDQKWNSIREKTLRWKELDRFQCGNIDWAKGPKGHYMHLTCDTSLSNKHCLSKAEKRKQKLEVDLERDNQSGGSISIYFSLFTEEA